MENKNLEDEKIKDRLKKIKNKIIVMSNKGGVGKSTVSSNIAYGLSLKGFKTGLLDIDIHGPNIPIIFGLEGKKLFTNDEGINPYLYSENLKIISIGFLLDDPDEPIIWRGPIKISFIRNVISEVNWGELDYLIVDCPPGTSDEPMSVIQTLNEPKYALIVTTGEKLSIQDARKCVKFCEKMSLNILGVIENMSGIICENCYNVTDLFSSSNNIEKMTREFNINVIGKLPFDPFIQASNCCGKPYLEIYKNTKTKEIMDSIIDNIINLT